MNPLQVALSVRTDYSLGESSFQIGKIIEQAKKLQLTHIGIADYMTVSAMPTLAEKAKKAGIEIITGVTIQVVDDPVAKIKDRENNGYRLKVYSKTEKGTHAIFAALSKSLEPDNFYYHPRLGLDDVLALEDVVVTTGDTHSLWRHPDFQVIHHKLLERFGSDLYEELVAINTPLYDKMNQIALKMAPNPNNVIITRPSFYAEPDDADATDVLRAITSNTPMSSNFLARPYTRDMCLMSPLQMVRQSREAIHRSSAQAAVAGVSASTALTSMTLLAEKCSYRFKKMAPSMPKMAPDEFKALCAAVAVGWKDRLSSPVWGHQPAEAELPVYRERLKFELAVLGKMGFSGYFLLVQDIVKWSKDSGILVGPGRGSVGGSLVAYLMGITDIDPIRFDLLFERFINPDRTDLPDADLDFMSGKRHMVVDYIISKYGKENVAGIVNFSTLGAASALRDTARLHELDPWEYACSKQMEKEHGVSVGLTESAERVPDIEKFKNERPVLWDFALRLEGSNRSLSQHAAGVIVSGEPVVNRAVVSTRGELPVVQWDKTQVENFGLIKIDILGLNTLDLIDTALDYVKGRHGKSIDILKLPLDDEYVLQAFAKGDSTGVFQFSGAGMKKLLREMAMGGPLTFEDLCAATALFRPGPLDAGMCDRYVQVKQGATVPHYEHPLLEECLSETFGVIVYQEQVMKICRVLAGMTPGQADSVRKAMGKKDAEKMAEYKTIFIEGASKSGMAPSAADQLWENIAGFAGYGFNKSHSYEYTLLSWVTMWLKVHYPAEFFAAAMTVIDDDDKLAPLVTDAQSRKLQVLPPDLNKSSARIEIEGEDKLYAPFQAIKGISSNVSAAIVKLREYGNHDTGCLAGVFTRSAKGDIMELDPIIQKIVLGGVKVNVTAREKLARVGAFHSIDGIGHKATHPDRLKDRLELCPGFTVDMVKPDRVLSVDHITKLKITAMIQGTKTCDGCSLRGAPHPLPRMGDHPRFMVVFDTPNWKEEKAGMLLEGDNALIVKAALKDIGLKPSDGYYTTLVKSMKPKDQKMLSNEQINGCSKWLKEEIAILKPPVIVAMGSNAIRFFSPGIKGTPSDLAGKAIFNADLDATIIFGINPATLFHNPGNVKLITAAFDKLGELLS
jgi:DNA polymerase-3 subunit alpha